MDKWFGSQVEKSGPTGGSTTNFMRKLICSLIIASSCVGAFAAAFTSTQTGLFSAGSTWVGGSAPSTAGDTWTIAAGHTVTYDVDNSSGAGWGASIVTGILKMQNGTQCYLKMNGNLSGAGDWQIGSVGTPVDFNAQNLPTVVIEFPGSVQCTMTKTGGIMWYGVTNKCFTVYLTNTVSVGATSLTVSNLPAGLGSNDVFYIGRNTIQGQAGELHLITNVTANTLSFNNPKDSGSTNSWWGSAFVGAIPTDNRAAGVVMSILSQPIVFYDKAQRAVSIFTLSASNTVRGVRIQNLGRGIATSSSCQGWTATRNTINNCGSGGLAYSSCQGWTATGNTVNNCSLGGLANSSCHGWIATGNTVNNCNSGGLAYSSCSGWTAIGNTINSCGSGGLAYASCSGWTATGNTINNCGSGGLAYGFCPGWTAIGNMVNNCGSGGLASSTCSGWTAIGNINNPTTQSLFIQCYDIHMSGTTSAGDTVPASLVMPSYGLIQKDYSSWITQGGSVYPTNAVGRSCFAHLSSSAVPNPLVISLSVRPGATRNVVVSAYTTNSISYRASMLQGDYLYPTNQIEFCGPSAVGGWTNYSLSFINTNSYTQPLSIWLETVGSAGSVGYSSVSVGADNSTVLFGGDESSVTPSYVGLMQQSVIGNGNAVDTITLTNGCNAGDRIFLVVSCEPAGGIPGMGPSLVTDSGANPWVLVGKSLTSGTYMASAIYASSTLFALTTNDTIQITWTNNTYTPKTFCVFNTRGNNGALDCSTTLAQATATTFAMQCSTANASDIAVSVFGMENTGSFTPTDGGFALIAAQNNTDGRIMRTYYKVLSATGTIDGGGTAGTSGTGHGELVIFKNQ